jgi:3-oxoacyl-[acyl-carrier protein] reductase
MSSRMALLLSSLSTMAVITPDAASFDGLTLVDTVGMEASGYNMQKVAKTDVAWVRVYPLPDQWTRQTGWCVDRSIVITGASKGIGRAAAEALAAAGWEIIGVARQAPTGFPGQFVTADLSDPESTAELGCDLAKRGDVLGIVNNVGVAKHESLEIATLADFSYIMDLNVRPALQLTQALLEGMRKAQFGRIVNVSSLVTRGFPFRSSYAAAKSALESLTRTMAVELALDGITANAVAPGPTETELFRENNPKGGEGERRYLAKVPMRRFADPEEIAATIAFLARDSAGFITGQTLFVDGGSSLGMI